jgi:hypothetical protein
MAVMLRVRRTSALERFFSRHDKIHRCIEFILASTRDTLEDISILFGVGERCVEHSRLPDRIEDIIIVCAEQTVADTKSNSVERANHGLEYSHNDEINRDNQSKDAAKGISRPSKTVCLVKELQQERNTPTVRAQKPA